MAHFPPFNLEKGVSQPRNLAEIIAGESIACRRCMCTGVEYNWLNLNEANRLSVRYRWDQALQSAEGGSHCVYKVKVSGFEMGAHKRETNAIHA